jgi:branched-chain amino acid transport system substrate-binding protein
MAQVVKSPITIGLIILVLVLAGVAGLLAARPPEQITTTKIETTTITLSVGETIRTITVTAPGAISTVTIPGPASTITVTETRPPAQIEYVIGFAMAVSGPYAVDGPVRRDGGILAIEHINRYLESIGSPIRFRFVHDDTKGAAADALKVIQSMYAAGIKVIVGPFSSGEVRGVMDFANTNKIVIISPSSTSPLLAVPGDYIFRTVPTDLFQAEVVAKVMSDQGIKKVAVMARGDDYGKGLTDAFERVFTQKYNGRVLKLIYTVPQPDYASEVARLSSMVAELGADASTAVFIIAFEDDGLNIIGHARLDPVLSRVRWFGSETLRRPAAYLPEPDGKASKDVADFLAKVKLTGVFASPRGSPLASVFEQEYTARFGRSPSPYTYFTYDSVWLAALAILFAGKYDGEAVAKALPVVGEHFIGVTGYKTFNENGDAAGADYTIWQYTFDGTKYKFEDIGVWRYPAGVTEYYK